MRLTCPNCSAQYEVPDEVIPEEGRDVQCSNCEKTWFQAKYPDQPAPAAAQPVAEDTPPEPEPAPVEEPKSKGTDIKVEVKPKDTPQPEPEPAPPTEKPAATGNIDPAVASILQEEASREADLRAQEGSSLETQPDLALDTPAEPDPDTDRAIKELTTSETAQDAGQKDALPDVDAINSTLRKEDIMVGDGDGDEAPRKSGGFMRGFALILIIGIVLVLIYGNAQQISEAVPQADPILEPYVSMVDQARIWLEAQTSGSAQN